MFRKPPNADPTAHLRVIRLGPQIEFTEPELDQLHAAFAGFGECELYAQGPTAFFSYLSASEASKALQSLDGTSVLQNSSDNNKPSVGLEVRHCIRRQQQGGSVQGQGPPPDAVCTSDETGIPGLLLVTDFVTEEEERELLARIDANEDGWVGLAKRRVQHYGRRFEYAVRGVDLRQPGDPLPDWLLPLAGRVARLGARLEGGGELGAPGEAGADWPTGARWEPDGKLGTPLEPADGPRAHEEAARKLEVPLSFNQVTVNEYSPGVGLSPHVDTHSAFEGAIVSLSLAGPCVIEFRRGAERRALLLPARSLLVMGGESRYAWQHYIPHRKSDIVGGITVQRPPRRISITLRQVRAPGEPCRCRWPECCDSQQGALPPTRLQQLKEQQQQQQEEVCHQPASCPAGTMDQGNASPTSRQGGHRPSPAPTLSPASAGRAPVPAAAAEAVEQLERELEAAYVHHVYDAIAPHFSATRFAIWPKVKAFLEELPPGSMVADVGCGNGKYFGVRRDLAVMGSDRSQGLAQVAARRLHPSGLPSLYIPTADVMVADALALPYRGACCDAALCVAVLHHISSERRRLRLLGELARLLKPGGRALVTVWAKEQEDPRKTLDKWRKFDGAPPPPQQQQQQQEQQEQREDPGREQQRAAARQDKSPPAGVPELEPAPETAGVAAAAAAAPAAAATSQVEGGGPQAAGSLPSDGAPPFSGDYLVPWHLPFHRAGGAAAAAVLQRQQQEQEQRDRNHHEQEQRQGQQQQQQEQQQQQQQQERRHQPAAALALDASKSSVVLQRYYHLFGREELEALVAGVPGVVLAASFYDRSNWCAVFEKL